MNEKVPFKVGDKVALIQSSGWGLDTIKAISPKRGDISLEKSGRIFDKTGWEKVSGYHHAYLEHATQEHADTIKRSNIVYRLKETNLDALSLDELKQIDDIIKPHYEASKK